MTRYRPLGASLLLAASLWSARAARAQETASDTLLTVQHYLDWEQVSDPQVSPDGSQVIYGRRWVNKLADKWESALWIVNADGSRNRFLVKGSSARWSPDGSRIAYLAEADGEPKGNQIFVRWMDAEGATSQITRLTEAPSVVRWSPDGKGLSFAMLVPQKSDWSISLPKSPEGGTWTPAPRMVDRLHYRQDRQGFMPGGFLHLFLVPADGGTPRQLTSGDWNAGARFDGLEQGVGYDWTPDGKTIVFDGLRDADADYRYRESHLHAVDVGTGAIRQLTSRRGNWTGPVIAPDGKTIAFSGFDSTTQSYKTDELYLIGIDGSGMRQISGDLDRDVRGARWAPDGSAVVFTAGDRGTSNVYLAALRGSVTKVTDGAHLLSLSSIARDFSAVGTRSDPKAPADVVRLNLRQPKTITRLTSVNDDVLGNKRLGPLEEVWYPSTGGTRVQGWIVKPPSFDPAKKYPLILEIHGGPHGMYNVGFNYMFQNFAANGYVVLYTNPRGSTGYG
ncbi:MAG: S9 family peptidase, partial [Gemmatimonadetes bacterium]|nr:S9 family peptidase [Gemmatimonadota bacterium]